MSEFRDLLLETADRVFADHCDRKLLAAAEAGVWPEPLWQALGEAGLATALLPESAGGAGLALGDALALLGSAARYAAPMPLAETLMASWLFGQSGLAIPEGPHSIAPVQRGDAIRAERSGGTWHVDGRAARIPWARHAQAIAILAAGPDGPVVASLAPSECTIEESTNLAGEPRDEMTIDVTLPEAAVGRAPITPAEFRALGAAMRSVQIAGALARVLEMTVTYANDRVQFGRPIGKFQAVQQNLAVLAAQAAAAAAAADIAIDALSDGIDTLAIGCAKARAGEAAGIGAALAHQVHGAIGFTHEHALHFLTRRLWSWRDEFGGEAEWALDIGRAAAARGAHALWPMITAMP